MNSAEKATENNDINPYIDNYCNIMPPSVAYIVRVYYMGVVIIIYQLKLIDFIFVIFHFERVVDTVDLVYRTRAGTYTAAHSQNRSATGKRPVKTTSPSGKTSVQKQQLWSRYPSAIEYNILLGIHLS